MIKFQIEIQRPGDASPLIFMRSTLRPHTPENLISCKWVPDGELPESGCVVSWAIGMNPFAGPLVTKPGTTIIIKVEEE